MKSWSESQNRVVEWVCKLGVFNAAVVAAYALISHIGFSLEAFELPGVSAPMTVILAAFLVAGNVVFVLYDVALTRLLPLYFARFQPLLRRLFR